MKYFNILEFPRRHFTILITFFSSVQGGCKKCVINFFFVD